MPAWRLLREIGEELKSEGVIKDYSVRHQASRVLGYAGEIVAIFYEPKRRYAVSLVFCHTEDEVKTRPDGVGGYAMYRRIKGTRLDQNLLPEDRRPLFGTYPEALVKLVKVMLQDHPEKQGRETKAAS